MAISSVIGKYLGKSVAMDGVWEETKHHRSDDGRFSSGTGRGKAKGDKEDEPTSHKKETSEGGREEMSDEKATQIVRRAFKEVKCDIEGLKLVDHALNASVKEADEGTLKAVNEHLTKHGLKAKISDQTTFKIAEDGYDDIQVVDDPMLEVLVDLCKIDMVAKDLHYRAKGKPFYGLHELADIAWGINRQSDDLNEVYYMGEKQIDPPDRAYVAGKASELVGKAGGEDELIQKLAQICDETAKAVENAKKTGVSSGTAAVLDEISKRSLQAKGLLARTMKSVENGKTIDAVISKGVYIKPEAAAQDSGTHEGAIKAAQTRKAHGWGNGGVAPHQASPKAQAQITENTHTPDQLKAAISKAPMIGGKGSAEGGALRSSLSNHALGHVLHRNGGNLPVGTRFVDESGNVGAYMGQRKMSNGLTSHTVKMANGTVHTGIPMQMPNLYLAREVGKYL